MRSVCGRLAEDTGNLRFEPGMRRFLWKSDGTCLGEERSREVIDLTEPDVIRQC